MVVSSMQISKMSFGAAEGKKTWRSVDKLLENNGDLHTCGEL